VTLGGMSGLRSALSDPVAVGVLVGLVVGKPVGVLAATWLVARFTRAELDGDLSWWDVLGLATLAGVGFTVSLLIGELAFGAGTDRDNHVKVAVLAGSVTAAMLAGTVLRARTKVYERLFAAEAVEAGHDGTPDAFESDR
jgi:NhaA family Na+:H+ antiporter